jgi:uncharacterized protein YqgC (DUF456 family)
LPAGHETVAVVSTLAWVALGLAVLGVVGSVLPVLPGAMLSLAGFVLYWWSTGYTDPSGVVVGAVALVALLAVVVDVAGSALSVYAGGASTRTVVVALVAGLLLGLVTGPVGFVLGVAGAAFAVEYHRTGDSDASGRAALFATVGVLGSAAIQLLLTTALLGVLVFVVVF